MCSSCGTNTRSICLSIICAITSKQLLGFKLPVPLLETSVSSMRSTSPEADKLRQAVLVIIDEITMLTKDGLRCIDSLLRDLMNNDKPFRGKVIIIRGNFRQTLPVVPRGLPCDSIKIPQQMVVEENLIEAIYSENLKDMEVEQLAKRVILAPTNKKTLEMNRSIIAKLQDEPHTFCSSDSIITEDQNDL
ncbi:hypothetical protein AVEN_50629-1 [Araneus ventricosus]|uniref:ATP-dependent DNA helicase n=1 Tax=Araneus ventricosus TaxID=182803 RepID=A0A4Y2ASG5_ARAVE|nr:hypothetical protein AVEN_50629-1 [Araneus ventricosus]